MVGGSHLILIRELSLSYSLTCIAPLLPNDNLPDCYITDIFITEWSTSFPDLYGIEWFNVNQQTST